MKKKTLTFLIFPFLFSGIYYNNINNNNLTDFIVLQEKTSPHPSQFINNYPLIKWGMNYEETKALIAKSGGNPVSVIKTEIAWDGKFNETYGRATVLLDEKSGSVYQMSLVLYGMDKLEKLYSDWQKKFTKEYGKISKKEDNSTSISLIWKLKGNYSVELRKIKDPDSPVINLNWVKN